MKFNLKLALASILVSALGVNAAKYVAQFKEPTSRIETDFSSHFEALNAKIQSVSNSRSAEVNKLNFKFNKVFSGYSGDFSEEVVEWIKTQPEIQAVQEDVVYQINALQSDAPWGLTRVSQRSKVRPEDKGNFWYTSETGQNVNVYILDTGVNVEHIDLEGRARWGKTFVEGSSDADVHGHGSHVAGTVAGRQYGVAKGANIIAAKVLGDDGFGSTAGIIAAIEWVVLDQPRAGEKLKGKVINMSLGGGKDTFLNEAVNKAVDSGVHVVVAAGNSARDACNYSPASAEKAITVGATHVDDTLAWFSNWGKCVDILAPGQYIKSIWIGSNKATNNISGTSMASPHVAGVVADYVSLASADVISTQELTSKLLDLSTKNAITPLRKDTVNLLAYNNPPKWS